MIRIMQYGDIPDSEIFARADYASNAEDAVAAIIKRVREEGDKALLEYTREFDGAHLEALPVSEEEMEEALSLVEPEFLRILHRAAEHIRHFHRAQVRSSFMINDRPGVRDVCEGRA